MASVRKLKPEDPNSPWVCEYTNPTTGKRHRITPRTGLKKDAEAARRKVEAEIERGEHIAISQTVTVKEAVEAWLKDCERRWRIRDRMAGTTYHKYLSYSSNHVIPGLGAIKLTSLTSRQMQEFIDKKSEAMCRNTLAGFSIILCQTMKFAVDKGWVAISPLDRKKLRIPSDRKEKLNIPSKEELSTIFKALFERGKGEPHGAFQNRIIIVLLAVFAGLRRGEIVGLQWDDVDLVNERLTIRHSLSIYDGLKEPKTKHSVRQVPLAPQVAQALRSMRNATEADPTGYVLKTRTGKPLDPRDMFGFWAGVMKKAGLMAENGTRPLYKFHSLRHVNVSLLIALGLQPFHIQKLVGHASISTTMNVYGHLFPNDESSREAISAAASQFDLVRAVPLIGARSQTSATQARLPPPTD